MTKGALGSLVSTLSLTAVVLLGIIITLVVSKILSKTILKGLPSSFTLELPPYRKPQVGRIIVRSILDRTIFVLGRAVAVAAPAGLIIWIMANISIGGASILAHTAGFLDPFGKMLGMDGYIILAFILGLPANEIVLPIIIMSYMASGSLIELSELEHLRQLLASNGWTWLTGVCVMLFSLMHFPCATTLWTIRKETQSMKWTLVSFAVPTIAGIIVCFIMANTVRLLGLV
jgi:ferrous iron transport protein B